MKTSYTFTTCPSCGGSRASADGRDLRTVREETGVTLRGFAKLAEMSPTHISDVENGNRSCTPRLLKVYLALVERHRKRAMSAHRSRSCLS